MTAQSHIAEQWWSEPSSSGLTRGSFGTVTGSNFRDRQAQPPAATSGIARHSHQWELPTHPHNSRCNCPASPRAAPACLLLAFLIYYL